MAMAEDNVCRANYLDNGNNDQVIERPDESNLVSDLEDDDDDEQLEGAVALVNPQFLLCPEFEFSTSACYVCNGFYGPCFDEPVCATCHAFLFPDDIGLLNVPIFSEKTDDEDSGNDEPVDLYFNNDQRTSRTDYSRNSSQESTPLVSSPSNSPVQNLGAHYFLQHFNNRVGERLDDRQNALPVNNDDAANHLDHIDDNLEQDNHQDMNLNLLQIRQDFENNQQLDVLEDDFQSPEDESLPNDEPDQENHGLYQPARNCQVFAEKGEPSRLWNLSNRLDMLTNYKDHEHYKGLNEQGLVNRLPPEVLLAIFRYLDDISLWCVANVCRRWFNLLSNHMPPDLWEKFVKKRWPLFKPSNESITNWYKVYDRLAASAPCKTCLSQISLYCLRPFRGEENSWRGNRLRIELRGLRNDPPEGIQATPLDQNCCHWQATITGPAGSPYEGGLFYLYLQVPFSYPMRPPVVRFLTKILHPNVSRHGDVGIDSIHHNWSLALTISKVLISVQSLLTDPYCQVCMEPELGEMYMNDRTRFEQIARAWTRRYATHSSAELS
ncbi:uncharacterized protein LOC106660075 [Trichogramma pretiosum]|uniref:uncharacterized protein LOC106660075 n=1 Tax=Trichogramma pretiosum TaxID=7493 RepID=UPI0006C97D8D|nr:uncharacterized protein LOC106660075 [Trichogramma pretiosum]